jgi:hypothetical protein
MMRGWSAVSLAGLAFLLVLANIALAILNQRIQSEVSARQQFLLTGTEYRRVGDTLVHSLDTVAASTRDSQLLAMMQRHGITPPSAAASKPENEKKKER